MSKRLSPTEADEIIRRSIKQFVALHGSPAPAWRVRKQTYEPGESVLHADSRSGGFGLVVEGQLAVLASPSAARPLVVLTRGLTFGQRGARVLPADLPLKALTHCEIWLLEPATAGSTMSADPSGANRAKRAERWAFLGLALLIVLAVTLLALPATQAELAVLPMSLGDWCHQRGDTWCASRAWTLAGRMAPLNASPLLALGMQAMERNDLGAAEQRFEQARTLDPGSPEPYNNLGIVYYQRKEYERAVPAFEQALALDPGSAAAQQNLADSLLAVQSYYEALGHYQVAQSLGGSGAELLANMAIAYYKVGQPAEAVDLLHRALTLTTEEKIRNLIARHLATIRAETEDSGVP